MMKYNVYYILIVTFLTLVLQWAVVLAQQIQDDEEEQSIMTALTTNDDDQHCYIKRDSRKLKKRVWTVGVLAIRGHDSAYEEFNNTFATYLTATAGRRFEPPIEFRMKPLNFLNVFSDSEEGLVDFIYVNPSAFSCIESEYVR